MLNYIWLALIVAGVLIGGAAGRMKEVTDGAIKGAETAVTLAFGLLGIMSLWLGIMRLAERSGLVSTLSSLLRPGLRLLFPDVPPNHPAMGAMVMNISANMLGLNNASTPLGLRAMRDLETLNPRPGTATNAMCTFLAINTSSIQLIPMTAVALLAAAGSKQPTAIIGTSIMATMCAAIAAVVTVKTLEKLSWFSLPPISNSPSELGAAPKPAVEAAPAPATPPPSPDVPAGPKPWWHWTALGAFALMFLWLFVRLAFPTLLGVAPIGQADPNSSPLVRAINTLSLLAIPFLISFFPLYAALLKIHVYEEFVEGAKEGFQVAVRIIPYMVAMLVAVGMFRSAGGVDMVTQFLQPVFTFFHFPGEILPLGLMRPLSGSATLALFSDLIKQFGPDSLIARTAGTLYGSTETTFYVIAVYFGSVGVKVTRHAIPAGLVADAAGVIASVIICRIVFL